MRSLKNNARKRFGQSYWYIENGLMKHSRDFYTKTDHARFNNFNYFHNEDDCIEEIERLKTKNNEL